MDRYIGKFLDNRYELLEVIGTGGMAVVYKARCHRLNRLVAVKILKSDLAQDAEFRRRFHDESQAVAMLSHPNIVAVYDVSHSDDLDYIVMELIDGITLKQYMQKKGMPLNWREALHFITQIMRALSHAHSRGIIHRDIKPHNIMVLRDGSVKVADFGIARLTSAAQSTLTQEALGSVQYISPEQARGSHIDNRSDIYSAGVVLYEMITGRLPFEGESPVSVAIQHINSIPLSPRELNPEIPEALETITMKAMAPNVDERYISADAMLGDLEEFRKNPSINFEYPTAEIGPDDSSDEPTRAVGPIPAIDRREERRREPEPRPGRERRRHGEDDTVQEDYEDDRKGPIWPILVAVGAIVIFIGVVIWFLWGSLSGMLGFGSETELYRVPNLKGKTLAEIYADESITERFEIQEGKLVSSDSYEVGQVVEQEPAAGTEVEIRDESDRHTIIVDISSGGKEMVVPTVENMERRMAMELLRDRMGLIVTEEKENSETITKGYAIRTNLPANTPVQKGTAITLVISDGPAPITMISLIGEPLEKAEKKLTDMGLVLGTVTREPSEEYPEGTVIWQSKDASTNVFPKDSIDLRVSEGAPQPSESPSASPSATPEVTPTPPPSATPTVTPSAAPEVTPTPPPSAAKQITIELPASAVDKSSVQVRVEVDNVVKKNDTVQTAFFPIMPTITGRGTQEVKVYIDDVLVSQFTETFS